MEVLDDFIRSKKNTREGCIFSPAVVEEAKEVVQNFTKKRGSNVMKTEKTSKKAQDRKSVV